MSDSERRVRVPVKLPESLMARLDSEAQRLDWTRTAAIEAAVEAWLNVGRGSGPGAQPTGVQLAEATVVRARREEDGTVRAYGTVDGLHGEYVVATWDAHRRQWARARVSQFMPVDPRIANQLEATTAQLIRGPGARASSDVKAGVQPIPKSDG